MAGQKGTTVSVQGLFKRLPVRRRDLEKNIKREYGKVLNLLHAYACIGTGVRFNVKNTVGKTKNVVVFSTSGNPSTKQNIANVYGAKTLSALIPLDLSLEFEPSTTATQRRLGGGGGGGNGKDEDTKIQVRGHISRPVFGEGRQTPDRQMFFVNARPCGLPQIAKAFNEVYKSFNVSQSPFIFADFQMDTNAYDVNVSPDKRTILLHDAGAMIESLKASLTGLFEASDQTVPQSQLGFKQSTSSKPRVPAEEESGQGTTEGTKSSQQMPPSPVRSSQPAIQPDSPVIPTRPKYIEQREDTEPGDEAEEEAEEEEEDISEPSQSTAISDEQPISSQADSSIDTPNAVQNAFDRMRPRRMPAEVATITIGNRTVTSMVGSGAPKRSADSSSSTGSSVARKRRIHTPSRPNIFGQFAAPGLQSTAEEEEDEEEEEEDNEGEGEEEEDEEEENEREEEEKEDEREDAEEEEEEEEEDEEYVEQQAGHALEEPDVPEHDASDTEMQDTQASTEPNEKNEMTEEEKKAHEEAEVQRLIREAENKAALPEEHGANRANKMNKGAAHRDSTVHLKTSVNGSLSRIQAQTEKLLGTLRSQTVDDSTSTDADEAATTQQTAEDRLSLTVTKDDFSRMRIIGQFNLGFIIATRPSSNGSSGVDNNKDELFIIDQHASDEKINFERLQATTVVQNQRLVQPKTLDLTAVEEEIVLENRASLEKNGFIVTIDDSGNEPIGRRCKLVSLPLSKEVVFGIRDLEELVVLLSEMGSASDIYTPRPSKVRKMFAMRACRSSIMIGKTLTQRQMEKVVRNMGTIDKPWNCPHGRPTMRHLMSLGQWDDDWDEFGSSSAHVDGTDGIDVWKNYLQEAEEDEEE